MCLEENPKPLKKGVCVGGEKIGTEWVRIYCPGILSSGTNESQDSWWDPGVI